MFARLLFQPVSEKTVVITLGFKQPNWPVCLDILHKPNFGVIEGNSISLLVMMVFYTVQARTQQKQLLLSGTSAAFGKNLASSIQR